MYRTPIDVHKRLMNGEKPITYVLINTHYGCRAISVKEISDVFDVVTVNLADGSITAGGSVTAGSASMGIIDKSGRLLSISGLERSLTPQRTNLLTGWLGKDLQHLVVELDNIDDYFSKILPNEPFITRDVYVYVGFEDLSFSTHQCLFKGYITSVKIGDVLIVEADEKMSGLNDTWYLPRAGRYANPLNSNERLPYIYGDLTDSSSGNWILPCIDTVNHVYCFAAHAVLSVANGNSINIYADGVLVAPAGYTFNASNNYESEGVIATVTFTADQANAVISARGKGMASGASLMPNVIDQILDILTVQNSFSVSIFDATLKAKARDIFVTQNYKAAGVINSDINYWELLQGMMSSFLGSAFMNGAGDLCLEIDDGVISQSSFAGIVSMGDSDIEPTEMSSDDIINQCPASYAYNYVSGSEFKSHTDDIAHANLISQGTFGAQKPSEPYPLYWCRDLTSVQTIQDIIVEKFKEPLIPAVITDNTLKNIHVDVGDVIIYSAMRLYGKDGIRLYNNLWKVLGVTPDPINNIMKFRVLQTNYYLTRSANLADGTYLADGSIQAGGRRETSIIY